jgi:DNA-binding SARP family transcriptional activator
MAQTRRAVVLHILGSLNISVDGSSASLAPKLRQLLALLHARHGEWITTDALIDELWGPEAVPVSALKTLQGNILRIRRTLGDDAILARRGSYALNSEVVKSDSQEFERTANELLSVSPERSGPTEASMAIGLANEDPIAKALEVEKLWRGTPYADIVSSPSIDREARRLQDLYRRLRSLRFERVLESSDPRQIIDQLEVYVAEDPLQEASWALLIRALHASGRRSEALDAYGRARRVLAEELGIEPGANLRELESFVLRDQASTKTTPSETVPNVQPVTVPNADDDSSLDLAESFVGRRTELAVALRALRAARTGTRRTILIQGAAGIGKTRFLTEICAAARTVGTPVLVARNDSSIRRSYGVIIDLLDQLEDLAGTLPKLEDDDLNHRIVRLRLSRRAFNSDPFDKGVASDPALERRLMAEAVNKVITQSVRSLGSLLIAIEDVQWSDAASIEIIRELTISPLPVALAIAMTHRSDTRSPKLVEAVHEIERAGNLSRLVLHVMSRTEITELVGNVSQRRVEDVEGWIDDIVARTDGNTLLARELAAAIGSGSLQLPESIRDLVDANLWGCSQDAIALAEAGCLIGRSFDASLAYAATIKRATSKRATRNDVRVSSEPELLFELMACGLLADDTSTLSLFRHDLFRDAVAARLDTIEKRDLHLSILSELEDRLSEDLDALVLHSVEGGDPRRSAYRLAQRAKRSLGTGLLDESIADCLEALRWYEQDPDGSLFEELETSLLLADAQRLSLRTKEAEERLRRTAGRSIDLDPSDRNRIMAGAHRRIARIRNNERNYTEASAELLISADIVGQSEPQDATLIDEWIEVWLEASSIDYFAQGAAPWTIGAIDRIADSVTRRGDRRQTLELNRSRSTLLLRDTRFTGSLEAKTYQRQQRNLALSLGDLPLAANATFGLGFNYLCALDGASATPWFDEAVVRFERIGDRFWHAMALTYAATCRRLTGEVGDTEAMSVAAIPAARELPTSAYLGVLESNLVWGAIRRNEIDLAGDRIDSESESFREVVGLLAHPVELVRLQRTPSYDYPFVGFVVWPALWVAHVQGHLPMVSAHASHLLEPRLRQNPPFVEEALRLLTTLPTDAAIHAALQWARSVNFL